MDKKEILLKHCWDYVNKKREILKERGASLQESLHSETKSSAGDKHETGRAMVQLEQEKLGRQLLELDRMNLVLAQVDLESPSKKISLGSLVFTKTANYFIAVSCDPFKMKEGSTAFCVSANSPIAKSLLGKECGDTYTFLGKDHKIQEVY